MEIKIERYEIIEKIATQHATSVKVLTSRHWIGKRVRAVCIDPANEKKKEE